MKNEEILKLYEQIEVVYKLFKKVQEDAEVVVSNSHVTDNTAQLKDVLNHTEEATVTIINSATTIGSLLEGSEKKDEINNCITKIYEACSFQDISGQRIKKVLKNLNELDEKLTILADTAKIYMVKKQKPAEEQPILNGPELAKDAASQDDVDKLFQS